jgi:hypothetical protein
MPRMRTIRQTALYLRENDPDCALTETAIRRLLLTGTLPHVRIGAKHLLDLDVLEAFLRGYERV